MAKILVVGGASLLGQYVIHRAIQKGHHVWATNRAGGTGEPEALELRADLTDLVSLRNAFEETKPDSVFLCAALTDVDHCENHPDEAKAVNARGPRAVAELSKEAEARLIHVSTDYVFSGEDGPFDEEDEPRPLSVYGATKREGEISVLKTIPEAAVVRICAVFGWNRAREKANSVTWILRKLRRGETVSLFTDQRVSPSYAYDTASFLLDLTDSEGQGIFHFAPEDCVTRLELGEMVCDAFGQSRDLLRPSSLAAARLPARRPRHSCLVSKRLKETLNTPVRPLRDALIHMRETE